MGKSVHSTPEDILGVKQQVTARSQLGWRAHPICAQTEPLTCFTTLPKEGNEPLRSGSNVCFQMLQPIPVALLTPHYLHSCALALFAIPHSPPKSQPAAADKWASLARSRLWVAGWRLGLRVAVC